MLDPVGSLRGALKEFARHVNPPLAGFLSASGRDQCFVRADGCHLTTDTGEVFADWIAGFGSMNLGHNHPRIIDAMRAHLDEQRPNLYPEALNPFAGRLASRLVHAAGADFETCFFTNSGSEAVEAALKLAIAATGRRALVSASGAYHGTTCGALSVMAAGPYRTPFEPLLSDVVQVPFGDLAGLSVAVSARPVAAVILEPIQIESGVRVASAEYLAGAQEICARAGTLLILDEVQTGMGRTGTLFAFQGTAAVPDILVLAKALGGGAMPIGAVVSRNGIFTRAYGDYARCELHTSTFGGNSFACRVADTALELLTDPVFLAQVRARSDYLAGLLREHIAGHPLVERCELRGLLGGVTLREPDHPWMSWESFGVAEFADRPVAAAVLVHRLHRRRILVQICGHDWSTLRIEPPLVVDAAGCAAFVAALREELDWLLAQS